jgi:hypothetical protein
MRERRGNEREGDKGERVLGERGEEGDKGERGLGERGEERREREES